MKSQKNQNARRTLLPPELLLKLYHLYQKNDPLPYSYIQVPDERSFNKHTHIKYYVNESTTYLYKDVMRHSGITETTDNRNYNLSCGYPRDIEYYKDVKFYQKVNHFCGSFLLGRKSELDYRMEELFPLFPDLSNFYPQTFAIPRHKSRFEGEMHNRRYWIIKPDHSYCGKLIVLYDSTKPLDFDFSKFKGVVQEYIERPLTIFGKKFDLRLYVLVTSIRPLRIYMNTQGLARFCPKPYSFDSLDSDCHLTNFTLNKNDPDFVFFSNSKTEYVKNCKWSLRFFLSFLHLQMKIDVSKLMNDFEQIIITTLITSMTAIRICQEPRMKNRKSCYELFGFDILIDENLNCHLLEVNMNPNMSGQPSLLDYFIKYSLNLDIVRMANIIDFDLEKPDDKKEKLYADILNYEKKFADSISAERRRRVELKELNPWDQPVFADFEIIRDLIDELIRKDANPKKAALIPDYFDINEELDISKCKETKNDIEFNGTFSEKGHFRLIYPRPENAEKFAKCFGVLRYEDIVLHNWICMPDEEKFQIINSYFLGFESKY